MKLKRSSAGLMPAFGLGVAMLVASCGNGNNAGKEADDESPFHADNDIAMVVRCLADAISVGETLNDSDYNFHGVLTDGAGRPLYSDLAGMPGEWDVRITTSGTAELKSRRLGDLVTDDLQNYIVSALQLDTANVYKARDFKGRTQSIYNISGGYLIMISKTDTMRNGVTGDRMTILLTK